MELVSALGQYSDNEDEDDEDEHNFNLDKMELCDGKEDGCKDGLGGEGKSTASCTLVHSQLHYSTMLQSLVCVTCRTNQQRRQQEVSLRQDL